MIMNHSFQKFGRCSCFLGGLALCGLGAALCTRPNLGTSPIAAPPYVLSLVSSLSFGTWTIVVNAVMLLLQIVILRRNFQLFQLWQLPAAMVVGVFIDLGMWITSYWIPDHFLWRSLELIVGCWVTAVGIVMEIAAKITYLPGDGLVHVLSQKLSFSFGTVKVMLDVLLVLIAGGVIYSFKGTWDGLGVGTIVSAFLVGWMITYIQRLLRKWRIQST